MESKSVVEFNILIGLFRATCEQQSMLIGETKGHSKMIFNRWMKEGDRVLKIIEAHSNSEMLEDITCLIEDSVGVIRNK